MAGIGDIAREAGVKYEDVSKTFDGIRSLILKNEKITIQDFGTWSVEVQDERDARNPQEGGTVHVPSKSVPKFKFNYAFRKRIAESVKVDQDKLKKKREHKAKIQAQIAAKASGKTPAPAAPAKTKKSK
jgi:nucleoid DNA-binding protein